MGLEIFVSKLLILLVGVGPLCELCLLIDNRQKLLLGYSPVAVDVEMAPELLEIALVVPLELIAKVFNSNASGSVPSSTGKETK